MVIFSEISFPIRETCTSTAVLWCTYILNGYAGLDGKGIDYITNNSLPHYDFERYSSNNYCSWGCFTLS